MGNTQRFPLRHHPEFFSQARAASAASAHVWYIPADTTQVTFISSKKKLALATERNRAKRRLKAAMDQVSVPTGLWVILPKAAALHLPLPEMISQLATVMATLYDQDSH